MKCNLKFTGLSRLNNPLTRTVLFYLILIISLTSIWLYGLQEITHFKVSALPGHFLKQIGDMVILTSPFWFFSPRRKRLFAILPITLAIFVDINLWYFRSWNNLISPYLYFMFGNFNSTLWNSAVGLMRPADILPFAIALLSPISLLFLTPLDAGLTLKQKWLLVLLSAIIFSCSAFLKLRAIIIRDTKYQNDKTEQIYISGLSHLIEEIYLSSFNSNIYIPIENRAFTTGAVSFSINWISTLFQDTILQLFKNNPSDKDPEDVAAFIQNVPYSVPDSTFLKNRNKNLVLIIAESLNSNVIGDTINGIEITPTLNSLCNSSGSIYCKNIVPQIKDGSSIDGQTIINTGILPASFGITTKIYGSCLTDIPTLPSRFRDRNPLCITGSDGTTWNEGKINEKFGYKTFTQEYFKQNLNSLGSDRSMFDFSIHVIDSIKSSQPFFIQLVTVSMHIPYKENGIPQIKEFNSLPENDKNYLQAIRYFDTSLRNFIDQLKIRGVYDNTVIIVTSDHQQPGSDVDSTRIFFGAFNCGKTLKIDRIAGQMNIYPTILQIMGKDKSDVYNGLGRSLLDTALNGAVNSKENLIGNPDSPSRRAYEISNKIWRSNYFGRLPRQ